MLDGIGLECLAKTSGSKGLQLYVPLNTPAHTHEQASSFALAVAQVIEQAHPKLVRHRPEQGAPEGQGAHRLEPEQPAQDDDLRLLAPGPTAARRCPPRSTWDEVEAAADGEPLSFEAADVLARVEELGDLFADAATMRQDLPG